MASGVSETARAGDTRASQVVTSEGTLKTQTVVGEQEGYHGTESPQDCLSGARVSQ